ncbi:protein FAR1-RELATED SEQUENCE 9 [Brachypodium distachyon]|uniref:protein FAR1-RELATED SEQUENCE 9 n=1 Tax=Brachypodium distachyon TaxID=15368 RepID=UPI00052FF5B9|nr:protein FAR1-RELATED SEQUENCE 9 [Brachypodium distachyon]|eukprot:XP_010239431.1 protein FAR1-RELATED SEQUENCE 9 [Brachypodium distachyon]
MAGDEQVVDPYMLTQIQTEVRIHQTLKMFDDDASAVLAGTAGVEQPAYGSFTQMLQQPFNPQYKQMINDPMGFENNMFMITGRDGRDDYSEEPDDGDDDELEQRVYDDAAFDSEDYNDNTEPVSIACENLSVMANKADKSIDSENLSVITDGVQQQATGQTHRYEKQQAVGDPPAVEHLSREDIENYLKNETVLASQSYSQEVRGQHVPHINMSFCSDAEAFVFYNTYASIVGFSAKKADGNCRKFYDLYGDCISFDTTYKTNKYNLSFAPFVGITGHANNCLFACAILQNETVETFTWLFEEFLQCMGGKMPLTIITDQDVARKQAIPNVFTQTKHRNCLFHIKKKAEEKCARCFATRRTLHIEFNDIINKSQTEEEFEALWPAMMRKYKVENIKYFQHMWEIRKNFVPVYFKKDFFPFIHSTARSDGTNAIFKDNVGSTYSIISFLGEYQRISKSIVEKEREQDSKTRTTKPNLWAGPELELQAAKLYNRNIFYKFQKQLKMTQQVHVEEIEKNVSYQVYKSSMLAELDFRERKFMVMVDWANEDISCICVRFQKDGMLCCHALRVLLHLNILVLPEKYYIQRWRQAENVEARDKQYNVPLELMTENSHFRYSILSKKMTDLAANACQLT